MYGLEKNTKPAFEMDLEKDLKKNPHKAKELVHSVETKIQEVKSALRSGSKGPELDALGTLLNGYTALLKILNRLTTKK